MAKKRWTPPVCWKTKQTFILDAKKTPGVFLLYGWGKKIHPKPLKAITKVFYEQTKIPDTVVDFRYPSWIKPPSASVQEHQRHRFIYVTFFEPDFGLLLHCETQDWHLRQTSSNCSPAGAMHLAHLSATSHFFSWSVVGGSAEGWAASGTALPASQGGYYISTMSGLQFTDAVKSLATNKLSKSKQKPPSRMKKIQHGKRD